MLSFRLDGSAFLNGSTLINYLIHYNLIEESFEN